MQITAFARSCPQADRMAELRSNRHPRRNPGRGRARSAQRAWTLIELVGVLAIIAVLTAAGAAVGLAYYDQLVRTREHAALGELAEALRRSVIRDLMIPDQTGYANQIAKFSGQSPASVLVNPRGNSRILLIDPGVTNSGFDLPFNQTNAPLAGAGTGVPTNLRMLLVSSLGPALPNSLPAAPGGKPSATVFSNFWATPEGSLPTGLAWNGDPHDLCIQRVQFMDLLHPVALNHAEVTGLFTNGNIRLPGMNAFAPPSGAPFPYTHWYLQGTTLALSNETDSSILSEIVQAPLTFTYEKGRWVRGTDGLATGTGLRSGITGADFEEAVRQFLASSVAPPTNNGNPKKTVSGPGSRASAEAVVNAMSNYIRLGAIGPTQKSHMDEPLDDLRDALLDYTELPSGQLNKP